MKLCQYVIAIGILCGYTAFECDPKTNYITLMKEAMDDPSFDQEKFIQYNGCAVAQKAILKERAAMIASLEADDKDEPTPTLTQTISEGAQCSGGHCHAKAPQAETAHTPTPENGQQSTRTPQSPPPKPDEGFYVPDHQQSRQQHQTHQHHHNQQFGRDYNNQGTQTAPTPKDRKVYSGIGAIGAEAWNGIKYGWEKTKSAGQKITNAVPDNFISDSFSAYAYQQNCLTVLSNELIENNRLAYLPSMDCVYFAKMWYYGCDDPTCSTLETVTRRSTLPECIMDMNPTGQCTYLPRLTTVNNPASVLYFHNLYCLDCKDFDDLHDFDKHCHQQKQAYDSYDKKCVSPEKVRSNPKCDAVRAVTEFFSMSEHDQANLRPAYNDAFRQLVKDKITPLHSSLSFQQALVFCRAA